MENISKREEELTPRITDWVSESNIPEDIRWQPTRQRQRLLTKFAQELGNRTEGPESLKRRMRIKELMLRAWGRSQASLYENASTAELEHTFRALAAQWREETGHISSITKIVIHPCYQRIIGLGPNVIPLLLRELQTDEPDYWFWALNAITGEDPVNPEDLGNLPKMASAWLNWGEQRGYIDVDPPRIYVSESAAI